MIIGNGDIASVLKDQDDLIFFASGVSNSNEVDEREYKREEDLLLSQDMSQYFVYFSSLCVFYSHSRYAQHKRRMEMLVRNNYDRHCIIRIGNIIWGKNQNTLINFLKNKIKNNESFEIRDEYRYIINTNEFLHWINLIPPWSCEMNITGKRMKVYEIVNLIKAGLL